MQKISTNLYTHTVAALGAKDDWNQGRRRGVTNLRHAESEAWGSRGMGGKVEYPKSKWFVQVICKIHQATVDFGVPTFLGGSTVGMSQVKAYQALEALAAATKEDFSDVSRRGIHWVRLWAQTDWSPSSIIFYHLLSSSIIFYHLLSSSIIFYHLLSSSI